jgi:hypothetical protein
VAHLCHKRRKSAEKSGYCLVADEVILPLLLIVPRRNSPGHPDRRTNASITSSSEEDRTAALRTNSTDTSDGTAETSHRWSRTNRSVASAATIGRIASLTSNSSDTSISSDCGHAGLACSRLPSQHLPAQATGAELPEVRKINYGPGVSSDRMNRQAGPSPDGGARLRWELIVLLEAMPPMEALELKPHGLPLIPLLLTVPLLPVLLPHGRSP